MRSAQDRHDRNERGPSGSYPLPRVVLTCPPHAGRSQRPGGLRRRAPAMWGSGRRSRQWLRLASVFVRWPDHAAGEGATSSGCQTS